LQKEENQLIASGKTIATFHQIGRNAKSDRFEVMKAIGNAHQSKCVE